MNYDEVLDYFESIKLRGSKLGLERIYELLGLIRNPQNNLDFIHVTGTNGKGSVCSMTESVLRAAGYKTGMFVSPYILHFNESMRINGSDITNEELCEITEYVKYYAEGMDSLPTEYEVLTAVAMEYFRRNSCDVIVLETSMGGRLDCTNVSDKAFLSVITDVDMDHMAFLGDTIEKIAYEKAGIIKNNCPCVFGGENPSALKVISNKANECNADLTVVNYSSMTNIKHTLKGCDFDFNNYKNLHLPLLGLYQSKNTTVVMTMLDILKRKGMNIQEAAIRKGLSEVSWYGRFEMLSEKPIVIFDGGHNPQGITSAINTIKHYFSDDKVNVLMGVMADKDYKLMAEKISEVSDNVFTVTPNNSRALDANKLAEVFEEINIRAKAYKSIEDAVKSAYQNSCETGKPLIILGSLYMYADIRHAIEKIC